MTRNKSWIFYTLILLSVFLYSVYASKQNPGVGVPGSIQVQEESADPTLEHEHDGLVHTHEGDHDHEHEEEDIVSHAGQGFTNLPGFVPYTQEKAGYEITFSGARYGFDEELLRDVFAFDVRLRNESHEPYVRTGGNCDVAEGDRVVRNGSGVILSHITDAYPGQILEWTIRVILENDHQYVTKCVYAPSGSYGEEVTVEVEFPRPRGL